MKKIILIYCCILLVPAITHSQNIRVLFIGNSYTSANNLPNVFQQCANSAGFNVEVASNAPGGYTFQQHLSNATSLSLIQEGGWDFVVLQEQSQIPSFPIGQVETECFPFAAALNDSIEKYSPCGETVFYQTWGRQNGDSQNCPNWPPVCTYEGMDSLLSERYQTMADDNNAIVAAVGAVRRYLRENYPSLVLYQADGSHPSALGTYAAGCAFTSSLFRIDANLITFNGTFTVEEVAAVKEAVNAVVFNNLLAWNIGFFDFDVSFTYELIGDSLITDGECISCDSIVWNFGDGNTSSELSPIYVYNPGIYSLNMIGFHCGEVLSQSAEVFIEPQTNIQEFNPIPFIVFKNNLIINENLTDNQWKILDMAGRNCLKISNTHTNLESLTPGIYFLNNDKTGKNFRIVIND
jgi:hypothetical protein